MEGPPISIAIFLVLTGCGAAPEDFAPDDPDRFAAAADIIIGTEDGGEYPITEVQGVWQTAEGAVVVMDAATPFLHYYDSDGELEWTGAREGGGPNEFDRPGRAASDGATLMVENWGTRDLVEWDLALREEHSRSENRGRNSLALTYACGGSLINVFEAVADTAQPIWPEVRSIKHGEKTPALRKLGSDGWESISKRPQTGFPLTPSWPDARAVPFDDAVAWFDSFGITIYLLACRGGVPDSLTFSPPAHFLEIGGVRTTGISVVDDVVTVFYRPRDIRSDPPTQFFWWRPGTGATGRGTLPGDWRLHPESAGRVWVVDNRLYPQVLGIPSGQWLGLIGATW